MSDTGKKDPLAGMEGSREHPASGTGKLSFDGLRTRARQLSLREQLERQHFLLERLNAACARLIQAVEQGQVLEALGEIIGNLVGSEEVAIFRYRAAGHSFSKAWSVGVEADALRQFSLGAGLIGRTAAQGASQFRDRHFEGMLLPHERAMTACVILKSGGEVVGVIVILGLLPQKNGLEWVDYELLKFLETYGAVAVQLQDVQNNPVNL